MGIHNIATVSWGFVLNHGSVVRICDAVEGKRKREGRVSDFGEEPEINWEYLDDIFSAAVATTEAAAAAAAAGIRVATKFSVSIDVNEDSDATVSIFHHKGLGSVDKWGSDREGVFLFSEQVT
jgi:hypothetical protein